MKKPPFFKESQALKEKSKNSRFSRWRTNPVYLVVFDRQVPDEAFKGWGVA